MTITFDIPPYSRPPPTKEELNYAPLSVVDLSKWDRPNGKEELVNDLRVAIEDVGFLFVVGHGIEDDEVLRQLSIGSGPYCRDHCRLLKQCFLIGDAFFNLPLEVKRQHPCDFSVGKCVFFHIIPHLATDVDSKLFWVSRAVSNLGRFRGQVEHRDAQSAQGHSLSRPREASVRLPGGE